MKRNTTSIYDVHPGAAELYDLEFTSSDDCDFIIRLIGERICWRILEPFCGTGRIILPLAAKGHIVFGIDMAEHFLNRLQSKIYLLASSFQNNVDYKLDNALHSSWSNEMDLVILGSNCFYELPDKDSQENCIRKAYEALKPGGFVYVDNDHMEGNLDESWQNYSQVSAFPSGKTRQGVTIESYRQTIWFDVKKRIVKFKRTINITNQKGETSTVSFIQQKHPVSKLEVEQWLINNGFSIIKVFGDYSGNIYSKNSPKAIFWAQKVI